MNSNIVPFVIGIDVGTSGVRSLAVAANGDCLSESRRPLEDLPVVGAAHEQDPCNWWDAVCETLREILTSVRVSQQGLSGISVTSTSGSLVLVDREGKPLRPAMLYDDGRASAVASELNLGLPTGQASINASYSLAKALWIRQVEPAVWERAAHILHPADWLVYRLTGNLGVCDYSNALKLGYDRESSSWMDAVALANIPPAMFPRVIAPGDQVGSTTLLASRQTGVTPNVPIFAGASDGLASLIGSGAREPGHGNTTLGTTLVWKVLTASKPELAAGMYCHHLPNGLRVPGAASNTGPGSMKLNRIGLASEEADCRAAALLPTAMQCYMLGSRGERFPFLNPQAKTFCDGIPGSEEEGYAAQLQSLACVERWGYERLESCGVTVGNEIFSAGGAAASLVLSQLRANILNRIILRTANPSASFGAAILAAKSALFGGDLAATTRAMTRIVESHEPQLEPRERFEVAYSGFRTACARHGYA